MMQLAEHILTMNSHHLKWAGDSADPQQTFTHTQYDESDIPYLFRDLISNFKDWQSAVKWARDVVKGLY